MKRREVWRRWVDTSLSAGDATRRAILDVTGLPPGRFRVLRNLVDRSLTLVELAERTRADAPATTVIVNDLVERGLVERGPHPTNGRAKLVSLTPAGRAVVTKGRNAVDEPPPEFLALDAEDLAAFERVLEALRRATPRHG